MRALGRSFLAITLLAACGGGETSETETAGGESPADEASPPSDEVAAADPASTGADPDPEHVTEFLDRLDQDGVMTYEVSLPDAEGPRQVRMQVQQRVAQGGSVAVRLVPIGTPLGEEPVYPQWLVATHDALCGLEETAALTTPGFVPIDASGELLTEAASAQVWRVEERWTAVAAGTSGTEAALGWTFVERVSGVTQPLSDGNCVRLSREDAAATSTLVICSDVGVVERRDDPGDGRVTAWQLVSIGERSPVVE